jgi:hypothetical protein
MLVSEQLPNDRTDAGDAWSEREEAFLLFQDAGACHDRRIEAVRGSPDPALFGTPFGGVRRPAPSKWLVAEPLTNFPPILAH